MTVCDMDESQTSDHVKNNVVKIVNENGNFFGTGFFIVINQLKYCITCHHCINNIVDDIFIEKNNNKYSFYKFESGRKATLNKVLTFKPLS